MSDAYGVFQDRLKCTCGTYLALMEEEGLTTPEIMKCHSCGKVYDFEICLSNPRYPDDTNKNAKED